MTYRAVGSGTGQKEFVGEDNSYEAYNHFGSGDMALTDDYYTALKDEGIEVMHVPFVLGAMSFFHNIPGLPKSGSQGLNMTACLLARIFKAEITTWDHDDVLAVNPSLNVPSGQNITVYHRTYSSSTTTGITTYLRAGCPSEWSEDMVGGTIDWDASTVAVEGSGQMSSMISSTEYSIGYIDSGHGHDDGLSEIELENAAGYFRSSLEASDLGGVALAASKAIEINVVPSDPLLSFANVSLHNMPGDDTWPIVAVSYVYVRKDQTTTGTVGPLLKAFLQFIVSDEGQEMAEGYGFVGIPTAMVDVANAAIANLELESGQTEWTFEDATAAGTGQADYVFSGKRRSYYEYALGNVGDDVDTVGESLESTAASLASLEAKVDMYCTDDDNDDKNSEADGASRAAMGVAAAGLVIALVALIIACVGLKKVMDMEKDAKAMGNHASFKAEMANRA